MMNIVINKLFVFIGVLLVVTSEVSAVDSKYEIRADGLACSYCAYGIEKKFMAIKGVKHVDIKLKQGTVLVTADDKLTFEEQQLKTLFNDSGFTYRTMKKIPTPK